MAELKFVITGTPGVGKSTAINAISDVPTISTEAETTDELSALKSSTTVAFDFGEIILEDKQRIRLYGTPGQERFRYMWEILAEGALGLIILVDYSREDPLTDLSLYMQNFSKLINDTAVVIGVTRTEHIDDFDLSPFYEFLIKSDIVCPVFEVDPREKDDMILVMDALMSQLEYA